MPYVEEINVDDLLPNKLKEFGYIIYIRKSTDEKDKQVQSLEDQLTSCFNYAKNKGLKIALRNKYANEFDDKESRAEVNRFIKTEAKEIYKNYFVVLEKGSSKEAFLRPKWRKIIKWVKEWKIVWIISYHPDRQARNLLEAWEIIDLYDNFLVDLKYPTFYLENTATGKMLLGILFTLSKHYTDKLSTDVKRWIIANKLKWLFKWNRKPYWYILTKEGKLKIDPVYWPLIKKAFKMKLEGVPHKDIIDFLNKHNLKFRKELDSWKLKEENVTITNNILSNILYNWLYAWLLDYKENGVIKRVHLYKDPEIDFPVFISLEDFSKISAMKDNKSRSRYHLIKTQPLPYGFFITSENKKCSFYIQPKRKRKFLELVSQWEKVKEEEFFKANHYYYKIQRSKNWELGIYEKRKQSWKKLEFNYKNFLEDNVILPAIRKIDIEKAEKLLLKYSISFIDNFIAEHNNKYKKLIWTINRYKGLLSKTNDQNKLEDYSIKLENLEAELEELNKEIDNLITTFTDIKHKLWKLEEVIKEGNINKKRAIIWILFEKLVVDENYLYLYTHSFLKPIFNIKDNLVIKVNL